MRNDSSIRPHLYTVRLSPEEDARAHRIAEFLGMPISTLFRMLLLEKERALGLEAPKPKRRSA
jgi:antitoxin component of RelBE/YafQ-DinJ toxin-antitoxin module